VVVLSLIVLALYGFGKFFTREPESPTPAVDYATVVDQVRPVADFTVLAPPSLPKGWQANRAVYDIEGWHLGVLTADEEYISLDQAEVGVDRAVTRFADGSKADGEAEIGGDTWSVRKGPEGRTTYVRREGGATAVVIGTPSRSVIEKYISTLSTS
jgi:hypothetical protein